MSGAKETLFGLAAENVTFLSDAAKLEVTDHTSTLLRKGEGSYGKRKSTGCKTLLKSGQPSETVAFEKCGGSEEESVAVPAGSGVVGGLRSCVGSGDVDKTLTEFGVSELEAMARAKVDEWGPSLNVLSCSGIVHVPTEGSTTALALWKLLQQSINQVSRLRVY